MRATAEKITGKQKMIAVTRKALGLADCGRRAVTFAMFAGAHAGGVRLLVARFTTDFGPVRN